MRRFVVGSAVLGVFAAALGCQHVGGVNDVYHHPDNAVVNTGSGNPYHVTGAAVSSVGVAPVIPEAKPVEVPKVMEEAKPMPGAKPANPGK